MAADDEQALLAFLADLGDGDDPVDAADPDDAQEATDGPKEIKRRPSLNNLRVASPFCVLTAAAGFVGIPYRIRPE